VSLPGRVRPLAEEDIPRIADLYATIFGARDGAWPGGVPDYLRAIFCGNPWRDPDLPSLVAEDGGGRIIGCLGVMPRRMTFEGRAIQATVSHHFMVETSSRGSLAGLALAKRFLQGPQDLSLAEGGDLSRRLLEGLGGATSLLFSLRWTRPIRPSRYVLAFLRKRRLPAGAVAAMAPLCYAADALGPHLRSGPLQLPEPDLEAEELTPGGLLEGLAPAARHRTLRPVYDETSLGWLLGLLARRNGRGTLRGRMLRDASGSLAGWYLYYLKTGGTSEVVQIGALDGRFGEALDHLLHDAWRGGAVAVSGQIDPPTLQDLWRRSCVFHHDGASWLLAHARRPGVVEAIHRGDAFLSRLDGEWWIGL
jgi:hypothetical protein